MLSLRLFLAAGVFVVVLAGCGGEAPDEDGASELMSTPTTEAPTATTAATTPSPELSPTSEPTATEPAPSATVSEVGESVQYEHVASWGEPVIPQLPEDVHVAADGTIYTVDSARGEVQVLGPDGQLIDRWDAKASDTVSESDQPAFPILVTGDMSGNIYTFDGVIRRVSKFDSEGALLAEYIFENRNEPIRDLEFGSDGRLYAVTAGEPHQRMTPPPLGVYIFDQDLNEVAFWEAPEDVVPFGITFDNGLAHILTTTPAVDKPDIPQPSHVVTTDPAAYDPANWTANVMEIEPQAHFDGILAGPDGRLFVIHENDGGHPEEAPTAFYEIDATGALVRSWEVEDQRMVAFESAPGVDVGPDGLIYFADPASNRVLKISPDGAIEDELSDVGPARFAAPYGIAVGPDGNVFVADDGLGRVAIFDADGTFITERIYPVTFPHFLPTPNDIAVAENGDIHYVSARSIPAKAWLRIEPSGEVTTIEVDKFMSAEPGEGHFIFTPSSIAIGPDGVAYIAMDEQRWVRSYSTDGEFVEQWPAEDGSGLKSRAVAAGPNEVFALAGTVSSGSDRIDTAIIVPIGGDPAADAVASLPVNPLGDVDDATVGLIRTFTIDDEGNFYALAWESGDVIKLAPDGTFISRWSALVDGASDPHQLRDIAVDAEGRVFVIDGAARQVHVFAPVTG